MIDNQQNKTVPKTKGILKGDSILVLRPCKWLKFSIL